jgi:calmodulin
MAATRKLSKEEVAEYRQSFNSFDKNENGTISVKELGTVMRTLGQNPTQVGHAFEPRCHAECRPICNRS